MYEDYNEMPRAYRVSIVVQEEKPLDQQEEEKKDSSNFKEKIVPKPRSKRKIPLSDGESDDDKGDDDNQSDKSRDRR